MTVNKRDYLVGRRTMPAQARQCPRCGLGFVTYQPNVECRVCAQRPRDFFQNVIEVGDDYFTGNPPACGRVIKVNKSSILLEIGADYRGRNQTRGVKSPDQGVCLNKIPEEL